jgi:ectoine hydroxylase-related dioxygenase (phytanoyl-CoA dioxygenase family)
VKGLDAAQVEQFRRDGYVVCPGLVGTDVAEGLTFVLSRLIARIGDEHARGLREEAFWNQLRRSAHDVEVMWIPGAPGFAESRAMRIGHALHRHDGSFADLALRSPVTHALVSVLGAGAAVVQSAVVYKQPRSDAVQFGFHQDAAYLTCAPMSLALAYVALDDAGAESGGLRVAPGSHRLGLGERLRLGANGYEPVSGARARIPPDQDRLLTLRRGDVALVDGLTYHASGPNQSSGPRRGLIVHAIGPGSRMEASSWVQPPPGGFPLLRDVESNEAAA